jgi:hypothetical protein
LTYLETTWNALYLPPILARIQGMIVGDLNFTTTDVSIMPYLCGFESQITGQLSPWCGVFTDAELAQYEYSQDLRYYYGMGPGVDLPSKMMLPFVNSLVGILEQGPGVNGTFKNGTSYSLPKILTAFMNDGQITELGAAIGVWDNTTSLGNGTAIPAGYTYKASHFVTMRGTVAFERLNCKVSTPAKREIQNEPRGFVTETRKKTTTITICPTETPLFTTSSKATAVAPISSVVGTAENVISKTQPDYTMSTILSTHTYTITSCAPEVTNCPVGKVTETVYTSTTYCPVDASEVKATSAPASKTSTAAGEYTTSTILSTKTYTITSCAASVTDCPIGKVTETVYTSTTVCPVAGETGSAASGSATSGSVSGTSKASGTAVSGSSATNSGASATSTATPTGSSSSSGSGASNSIHVIRILLCVCKHYFDLHVCWRLLQFLSHLNLSIYFY